MGNSKFSFKRFTVYHGRSSMKIGVDAVLLGSWVTHDNPGNILDIGTGCGVIALILSQRYPEAKVEGIDIDPPSVEEAGINFHNSIYPGNMQARLEAFPDCFSTDFPRFDLIVSNPPFFNSGINNPSTSREKARHQATLSVFSILKNAKRIIKEKGKLAMIFPTDFRDRVIATAKENNFYLHRECFVRNNPNSPEKRIMTEFITDPEDNVTTEHLVLFEDGEPTEEYKNLCRDLYLKF